MNTKKWHMAVPAAIAAMTMALAGCGGNSAGGSDGTVAASDGNVELTLNWWGSDKRIKLTEEAVAGFEKAHPNIKVNLQYTDWSGYWDKLATSIAGGDMPDIVQMDELYLASYASQGSLYDLGKTSEFLDLSQMDTSLKGMGQVDGVQYAAPISSTPLGIVVNMDIVEKLGLTLPDTSKWTWDDMLDFSKQVVQKSNGEIIGIMPGMALQLWARMNGESLYSNGKVSISEATLAEYLQQAYDWTHGDDPISGQPDAWSENLTATTDQTAFATGREAMIFAQATQTTVYANSAGTTNMKLVEMPSYGKNDKYGYLKPGMYWAMSSKTEHPAEAAMLIDYLINNEEAGKILGTERGLPSNNKIRASLAAEASGTDKQALDFQDVVADTLGDAPSITPNGASDTDNVAKRYMQNVVFEKISSADAAKAMIEEIQNNINSAA